MIDLVHKVLIYWVEIWSVGLWFGLITVEINIFSKIVK